MTVTVTRVETEPTVRRFRRAPVLVAALTIFVEIAILWVTIKVDNSVLVPVLLVLAIGVLGVVATFVVDSRRERDQVPTTHGPHAAWLAVVGTFVVVVAGLIWILPLKMLMAEGAANLAAERQMGTPASQPCDRSSADLSTVSSLMTATQICGSIPPNPTVFFEGTPAPYDAGARLAEGLVFAPSGFGQIGPICVRHLVGSWSAYYFAPDDLGSCPLGYINVGSNP